MDFIERRLVELRRLQYVFFTLALACMIALIWFFTWWLQIAGTTLLLLIAGAVCKSGRNT